MQKFVLNKDEMELLKLENKVRIILAVVKGEIIVSNRKRGDLFVELQIRRFHCKEVGYRSVIMRCFAL